MRAWPDHTGRTGGFRVRTQRPAANPGCPTASGHVGACMQAAVTCRTENAPAKVNGAAAYARTLGLAGHARHGLNRGAPAAYFGGQLLANERTRDPARMSPGGRL